MAISDQQAVQTLPREGGRRENKTAQSADQPAPSAKTGATQSDSKNLFDRLTRNDAVTGAPRSRWLNCTGAVPDGQNSFSTATSLNAEHSQKRCSKPGKLGNGRISPKHPRLCSEHCNIVLVNGEELLNQCDFELPGPIPLSWRRTYRTSHNKDLGLGAGWTSPLLARLDLRDNEIIFCDGDGRETPFEWLTAGQSGYNPFEDLSLYCDDSTVYRVVSPDRSVLTFGGSGKRRRLYEIADRQGRAIKLFYSANDRLLQILDSAGRRLKIDYTIAEQIQRISLCDEEGRISGKPLVEYAYNDERDLVKVIDANGNAQSFEYRYHIITKHTNKDGFNYHFEWDEYTIKGKCTRHWGDDNIFNYRFKYDEINKITRCTNARDHTAEYHYNDLGLITTEIDPEGGVSQYHYSEEGRLLSERNPIGGTTQYRYDINGRLVSKEDATGSTQRFEYDEHGNQAKSIDPQGHQWLRRYDPQGRLIACQDPEGNTTQYQYDENGWLSDVTDSLGHTRRFEWGSKGELQWRSDAAGNKTHYMYDTFGRIVKIICNDQRTTHYSYDRMNRVTQIILPGGASVQMQYSPQGNLIQHIDAVGRSTRYKYDGLSQPVERIDASGKRRHYEYDKLRNIVAVINENGERQEFEYDKNQRLIRETGFDGRVQQYNYNAAGQLVRHLDGAHRVTSYKRDPMGRVLQKRTSTGEISQYEYDETGRMLKAYNSHSVLHFRYNSLGQLVGELQNNQRIQHRYNARGEKTHTTLPNGKTLRYDYDARGLLNRVSYSGKALCKLEYDSHAQEQHRHTGEISSRMEYDAMGRLLRQHSASDQRVLMERAYRYDKAGNLRQIEDAEEGRLKYHYDVLDRLEKIENGHTEQFTFDSTGNLLDAQYPEPEGYVQGNRIRVFQNFRFEYDDVGNLVRQFHGKLESRFYYNVANQLARAFKQGQTYEYFYDPLGRRVQKRDASGDTVFIWDGDRLIQEQSSGSIITHIHDPLRHIPLFQIRNDQVFYLHSDHEGTTHLLTDVDGNTVWQASYKTYGAVTLLENATQDNAIRFHGMYYDSETGLLYGGKYYYHPIIGRYVQQRTTHGQAGDNPYLYRIASSGSAEPYSVSVKPVDAADQPHFALPGERITPVKDHMQAAQALVLLAQCALIP